MHRSSRGLAAIFLVGWVVTASAASAQDAESSTKSTTLPAVEVEAPRQRQDVRIKPKHGAGRGGRSNRAAVQNPAPAASAAPAANATGISAAAPVAASEAALVGA